MGKRFCQDRQPFYIPRITLRVYGTAGSITKGNSNNRFYDEPGRMMWFQLVR